MNIIMIIIINDLHQIKDKPFPAIADQDSWGHMASPGLSELTHLPLDKIAAILQTIYSDAFS